MAAIASFSVAHENIPGFKGIIKKSLKKKFSRQAADILIIGGKLKI